MVLPQSRRRRRAQGRTRNTQKPRWWTLEESWKPQTWNRQGRSRVQRRRGTTLYQPATGRNITPLGRPTARKVNRDRAENRGVNISEYKAATGGSSATLGPLAAPRSDHEHDDWPTWTAASSGASPSWQASASSSSWEMSASSALLHIKGGTSGSMRHRGGKCIYKFVKRKKWPTMRAMTSWTKQGQTNATKGIKTKEEPAEVKSEHFSKKEGQRGNCGRPHEQHRAQAR